MIFKLDVIQQRTLKMLTEKFDDRVVDQMIVSDDKATAAERLRVYQRSYYGGLIGCLKAQFPVALSLLGEQIFTTFAKDYLEQYPSKSYTLNNLGQNLSHFFAENRPDKELAEKEQWIDFVIEVIEFEWIINVMFDAVEKPPITINENWNLNPNVTLFDHNFLTYALCYAVLNELDAPAIAPQQKNYGYIIRKNHQLKQVALTSEEFCCLAELVNHSCLPNDKELMSKLKSVGVLMSQR